jgi:hypothetical protein
MKRYRRTHTAFRLYINQGDENLDTIKFLEALGSHPMSNEEFAAAVTDLDVDATQRNALLDRDPAALADLLGGRSDMFFGILAPQEEPLDDEPAEERPEDSPEEAS